MRFKFFKKNKKLFYQSKAFTLVELLVTISLMIIFSASAAYFNRSSDQQIALYREQGRLANAVYQARSLAITTFNRSQLDYEVPCGYGIRLDSPNHLIIFKDLPNPVDDNCKTYITPHSPGFFDFGDEELIEEIFFKDITIKNGVNAIDDQNFVDILFVPPNPDVYSNVSLDDGIELNISASRVPTSLSVTINKFGQVVVD